MGYPQPLASGRCHFLSPITRSIRGYWCAQDNICITTYCAIAGADTPDDVATGIEGSERRGVLRI